MLRVTLEIANLLFNMERRAPLGRGLFQKPLQQTRKSNKASSGNWTNAIEAERLAMCASRPGPLCPSRGINGKALIDWRHERSQRRYVYMFSRCLYFRCGFGNFKLIYRYWATWSNTGAVQRRTWVRQMFARPASRITSSLVRVPKRQLRGPRPHRGTGGSIPSGIYWAPGLPHHPHRVPGGREPMA